MEIVETVVQHIKLTDPDSLIAEINADFEIIDNPSDHRGCALSEALLHSHFDVARVLVENGANVNATYYSQDQDTPEYFFGRYELATNTGVCWWLALGLKELLDLMKDHWLFVDALVLLT